MMCGIVGFAGVVKKGKWAQTHAILEAMFRASQRRGKDATGFVAQTLPHRRRSRSTIVLAKEATPASSFVAENADWLGLRRRRCSLILGHTRFATHGSPLSSINNHPLSGKDGLYLVHNGVITNHTMIAQRHDFDLRSRCDSEVALKLIESSPTPAQGLGRCLRECTGSMALAVLDARRRVLWLARNRLRPLWVCNLWDKGWFIASTSEIMREGLQAVYGQDAMEYISFLSPLAANTVHVLSPSGLLLCVHAL